MNQSGVRRTCLLNFTGSHFILSHSQSLQPWSNVQARLYVLQSTYSLPVHKEYGVQNTALWFCGEWTLDVEEECDDPKTALRTETPAKTEIEPWNPRRRNTVSCFHQGPVSRSIFSFPWIRRLCSSFCITVWSNSNTSTVHCCRGNTPMDKTISMWYDRPFD